jgi:hypothetical protein
MDLVPLVVCCKSADPTGDPALIWRAADRLAIGPDAAASAAGAGLAEFGTRVRFRHSLVRSAAYMSARAQDRQEAHQSLAEATDATADPDRRPGTGRKRRQLRTRTSPASWSSRRAGRRPGAGWLLRRHSWSVRRR